MLLFNIPFLKIRMFSGLWNLPKLKCDHTPFLSLQRKGTEERKRDGHRFKQVSFTWTVTKR
jgi:hypothetical protein